MKKRTFLKMSIHFCLALVLTVSLVACAGNSKARLTETQKEDIKVIVYDLVPKCLYATKNAGKVEFLKNSNHVTEDFRESTLSVIEERRSLLIRAQAHSYSSLRTIVFTTNPTITDLEFYDYKCENGQYSVMVRITLACTLQEVCISFGGNSTGKTPYQETQVYNCLISWDENECYLINSMLNG